MVKETREVIREFVRSSEALLRLADLSEEEEEVVGEMVVKLSEKLYPD